MSESVLRNRANSIQNKFMSYGAKMFDTDNEAYSN